MADVTFPGSQGELRGYLATPAEPGLYPGVVVIHDVFGMSDDLRRQCDWLASAGYLAFGPDLYSWGRKRVCLRATMTDLRAGHGRAFEDVSAARQWLASDARCTGRTGVIGYCMGGGFSLLLAPTGEYGAASVNYGHVPDDAERVLAGACPVIGSFGAKDKAMPGSAVKLAAALDAAGVDYDVKEYPDAGHGFMNKHGGGAGVLVAVVGKLVGVGYHEPSAANARARIVKFFDKHLKAS